MLDLPILESRYPDQFPTYDISQFLINGMAERSRGSVNAAVSANHVYWDCRIVTSGFIDPENPRFFENLPAELMPAIHVSRLAMHGSSTTQVQWNASWNFMQVYGTRIAYGELSFEARTPRRAV